MSETETNFNTKDLQSALERLESFTQKRKSEPFPHVYHADGASPTSRLKKTIRFAQFFISSTFSSRARQAHYDKAREDHDSLLHALDVIKSHHWLFEKYKNGNEKEQTLSKRAVQVFQQYNEMIDRAQQTPETWSDRLTYFFYKRSGISVDTHYPKLELPRPAFFTTEASKELKQRTFSFSESSASQKVAQIIQKNSFAMAQMEVDAFRMKVFTLLKEHSISFASKHDEFQAVRQAKIYTTVEDDIATLSMTLSDYPGELITIQGAFKREPESSTPSVPLPDTFRLATQSFQTGFPLPIQLHGGCTFADQMIPTCPHRPNQLPLFEPLNAKKKKAALSHLPGGRRIQSAKQQLYLTKEIFKSHQVELLELNQELSLALLHAASDNILPENGEKSIRTFYEQLAEHQDPMNYLVEAHQTIVENFIARPFAKLRETWLEQSDRELMDKDPHIGLQAAIKIMEQESYQVQKEILTHDLGATTPFERAALNYLDCMGHLIGAPAQSVMLQHLSEVIGFTPPMLDAFEQKVQAVLYQQLEAFLQRQDIETNEKALLNHIVQALEADIALFHLDHLDNAKSRAKDIVNELEVYYNSRFYARSR